MKNLFKLIMSVCMICFIPFNSDFSFAEISTLDSDGDGWKSTSIALGSDSFPMNGFIDDSNSKLNNIHCSNNTCNASSQEWSTGKTLITDGVGGRTSIAMGIDGFPIIIYNDNKNSVTKLIHCTNSFCDTMDQPNVIVTTSAGKDSSVTIGSDGFPIISYSAWGSLHTVHCTSLTCSTNEISPKLDGGPHDIAGKHNNSISIGTDGFPVISYFHHSDNLKLIHCKDPACNIYKKAILENPDRDIVGLYNSISTGSDGFPIISYQDRTNGGLKVVHCTNIQCSTIDAPLVLDSEGHVGHHTSIAIGDDGFPIISYHDYTKEDLKVVHCTNVSCSTFDTPLVLDSDGSVGRYSSIAIDQDGFPIISYVDYSNDLLKVVHCTSYSCSTHKNPLVLDNVVPFSVPSIVVGDNNSFHISYVGKPNNQLKTISKIGPCFSTNSVWVIDTNCFINVDTKVSGNVIIQNNSMLTLLDGATLEIDFENYFLSVESGSGIIVRDGGTIK